MSNRSELSVMSNKTGEFIYNLEMKKNREIIYGT